MEKLQRDKCKSFDSCGAPLCPMEISSFIGIWYPNEEICTNRIGSTLAWIKRQRKIAKGGSDPEKYFTYDMLYRNSVIKKGIKGLDPDQPEEVQLKKWFKTHPLKRLWTEKEKQEQRELLNKNLGRVKISTNCK